MLKLPALLGWILSAVVWAQPCEKEELVARVAPGSLLTPERLGAILRVESLAPRLAKLVRSGALARAGRSPLAQQITYDLLVQRQIRLRQPRVVAHTMASAANRELVLIRWVRLPRGGRGWFSHWLIPTGKVSPRLQSTFLEVIAGFLQAGLLTAYWHPSTQSLEFWAPLLNQKLKKMLSKLGFDSTETEHGQTTNVELQLPLDRAALVAAVEGTNS